MTSDSANTTKHSSLQLCMKELRSRKRATKLPHMKHEHVDGLRGDPSVIEVYSFDTYQRKQL